MYPTFPDDICKLTRARNPRLTGLCYMEFAVGPHMTAVMD